MRLSSTCATYVSIAYYFLLPMQYTENIILGTNFQSWVFVLHDLESVDSKKSGFWCVWLCLSYVMSMTKKLITTENSNLEFWMLSFEYSTWRCSLRPVILKRCVAEYFLNVYVS